MPYIALAMICDEDLVLDIKGQALTNCQSEERRLGNQITPKVVAAMVIWRIIHHFTGIESNNRQHLVQVETPSSLTIKK